MKLERLIRPLQLSRKRNKFALGPYTDGPEIRVRIISIIYGKKHAAVECSSVSSCQIVRSAM